MPVSGWVIEAALEELARGGCDLRDYRQAPLRRRLGERLEAASGGPEGYLARLAREPQEREALADHLLLHATSFFRDPEAFDALRRHVLPALFARAAERRAPLRAWVLGAATREEVYSLGMLCAEHARREGRAATILATDRVRRVVEVARRGRYMAADLEPVPADLRARYVVDDAAGGRIAPGVREAVSFAVHDLLGLQLAPPAALLAQFDLVLCRNLVLYLQPRFAEQAFARLRAVVAPGGALMLGQSEAPLGGGFVHFPGGRRGLQIYQRGGW